MGEEGPGVHHTDNLYRDEEKMEQDAAVIYLITLGILAGLTLREVNKKTSFPYSPMILIVGIFMGAFQGWLGFLGESTYTLSHMHPHLIVYIFIPVLLFESAFNCDWYVFKGQMINILILAGPGVGWGAILLGIVFKVFLFYGNDDMTWYQAFTLGSVLSATDPVAVVALLKELGASARFNHLIEGEALLNDGVAMVFFIFFNNLSKQSSGIGEGVTVGGVVLNFLQNSIVGPILGVVVAFFAGLWARRIVGDDIEVSWMTFVFAYLTFYWAEFGLFHTSGLLAVVALGLFWSAFGKTKIRSESEHAVHIVWGFVQYSADTLIFLLVGIIVGTEVIEENYIYASDYLRMFIFFIFMIIARYVMIISFWPLIKRFGYPISQKELVVLVYGGLRGALGLTLSLLVGCDQQLPARFRHLTVFFTAGMAALTNLINGTTCKLLVNYLQMIENSPVKKKVYKTYLRELIVTSDAKQKELEVDEQYNLVDWQQLNTLTGEHQLLDEVKALEQQLRDDGHSSRISYDGVGESELKGEIRYRILRILKGLYYQKFEHGVCEADSLRLLVESSDVGLDHTRQLLNMWELLFTSFSSFDVIQYIFKFKEYPVIGKYAGQTITRHLGFVYDVTTTFISCSNEAINLQMHIPMNKTQVQQVMDELRAEVVKSENYLTQLYDMYPEIIRAIQTKRAAHAILSHQRHHLEETQQNGLIDDKEYYQLKKSIDRRLVQLENHVFQWQAPQFDSFVMQFPVFSCLSKQDIQSIISFTGMKTYMPDETIYDKGVKCQNAFIILKGNVQDEVGRHLVKKSLGAFLSYANVIGNGVYQTTARATTNTVTNSISLSILKQIMERNPEFEARMYISSMDYLVKMNEKLAGPLALLDTNKLNSFIRRSSKFRKFDAEQQVDFSFGGYIFKGEAQTLYGEGNEGIIKFREYTYVPPIEGALLVNQTLICLIFDDDVGSAQQQNLEKFNLEQHDEAINQRFSQIHLQ